jgi:curved DNA-binding protein CbpA
MRTLYDVLGVRPDVDGEAIKLAFRTLAKAWHPDANTGDRWSEQRFKQITAAYTTLGHPATRAAYDERLATTRRRRKRRILEVIYCVVIAIVSFALEKAGIELYRAVSAASPPAVASGEPVVTGALADRQSSGPFATFSQILAEDAAAAPERAEAAPPGNWAPPPLPELGQPAGSKEANAAALDRGGAPPLVDPAPAMRADTTRTNTIQKDTSQTDTSQTDTSQVRVREGGGKDAKAQTFTVHREVTDRPAGDDRNAAAYGKVEIRVWTVGRDHGSPRRFTVEREQPPLERSSDAATTRR